MSARKSLRLGVLISGSGTNLQALINAIEAGDLDAKIELVVSSRSGVAGIERAQNADIPVLVMQPSDYDDPIAADKTIVDALLAHDVEYVCMAGYMRMVREPLLTAFPMRIINIHPALLPSFKGAHGIQDAFDYGVKITGVTIHFADESYDCGPIIAQRSLEVQEDWTVEELEAAIHEIEHELYPQTLQKIAEGRVSIDASGRVHVA